MAELKKIFKKRDKAFEKQTLEIFKLIDTSLICVTQFLNDIDPFCYAGDLSWEDTNLIDDLIVLIGTIEFFPGQTIDIEGEIIKITEGNVEAFNRVVHMTLPLSLVQTGTYDEILDFLYEMHNEELAQHLMEQEKPEEDIKYDFDLTKLNKKQRYALALYNAREKK